MSRENDSVIFKLLKSADVINDDTQEISQQFDGESYPKLPEANMLELGEIALNIAKDYEVIAIKNNEGEIVYIPFNVAIRLLTLEGDVADLAQYTEESVETLSAATVSIYNNLEEFKVEISNRLVQEITSLSGNVFTTIDSLSATTDAKIAAEKERAVSAETALNTALSNLSNHLDDIIPSDTDISNKLTNKGYVDSEIKKITDVIPNDTSSGNPLTNEAFVNSSISTSTATFRGTYNLITDLHLTSAATTSEIAAAVGEVVLVCDKNDYAYVQIPTSETATTEILRIERYKYDGTAWGFEYALNNSGFTAKQWAAINSGIVAGLVVKLEDLPNKAELDALFEAKQDKLTFDNTPRYGSNNPVTSGGIKGAVDERLPLSGGTVTGDLILNIGYGTNVSLKANSNRNFLRFNDSYNGYIIGDGNVRLALETGNVDLKHRYTTSSGATDYVIVDTRNIQENLTPNLKTLNGTPIVGAGDIDIKDIYLAMYRVTPYSSIMEAYWRGKAILVMGFDGIVYFLSKITLSEALFTHFDQTTMTVSSFTVNTSNVYSDITSQQLQENLVSGENIKTINNNSILGSGNIALQVPIDSSNQLDADYVNDASSLHKFVSTEEKAKWDAKLPLSGGTMTGDLDLNGNALLIRKSGDDARYGIRFITGEGVREGIYVGNPNMRLILEADPNLDLIHKKGDGFYDILDTNNVATKGNIYQTTWGDTLDNIINAANAGKIVILKRDITYNEQKYSPTYVLNCFIKRVSDDYITEAHFYARLEDNVVAEIACKRGPTWVDNGVMQLQENLVSGTNIKTINGNSVLGSGNIDTQEVFVGRYGQTSYTEISLACFNFKSIWIEEDSKPENRFALSCNLGSGVGFVFYRIKPEQIEWFTLDEHSVYSSIYSLDLQSKLTFDNVPTSGSTNPVTSDGIKTALGAKQETLVSGTNIKTINSQTILGSGDIALQVPIDPSNQLDADLVDDNNATHKFVTATEKTTWNNKANVVDGKVQAINGFEVTGDSSNVDCLLLPFWFTSGGFQVLPVLTRNGLNEVVIGHSQVSDLVFKFNNTSVSMTTLAQQGALADSAYQKPLDGIPASDIASGVIPDVSQFVTRSVNDLLNYYTKQNTYTQPEVDALIGSIQHFHYEIYTELPQSGESNVLYLIGPSGSGKDMYEEYVYANNSFTKIGDTSIDLSGYVTTQALNTALANYVTSTDLTTLLSGKQNTLVSGTNIKTINGQSLLGSGNLSISGVSIETLNSALSNTVAESGVYDVTANNDNAKFSSLSALLSSENLDTLIPTAKRKGGMSIKFVLSSDNKYVQYRLTAEAFSTNVEDWEEAGDVTKEDLENGTVIPALANNLASWAGSTQNANYTQEGVVETTGGDLSIDSSVPATLMSIAAKTDFAATKLVATGFNLLRRAMAVGDGWYFMVPALSFGTINTASQPNGVLFTNSQGENLRPTVYFKPLASGVPTSVTDGTACAYTDASTGGKDYRFFTTSQAGYIIVSGIDRAATCAHIGWSKRYDEYIAIDNVNDAGSEVDIAAGIHALHSYDKMLTVGNVADRIEKSGDNQVTWHRLVDHVQPTWTNTPVESEGAPTGDYIHTATISGMKVGGAAAFETLGITLLVDGTTISFTDQNATVENDYVKYELATEATGTAAVSSSFTVEDWGLIIIQGTVGSAYINIAYAQGIPDSVRQMLSNIDNKTIPVIAEAMLYLYNENKALQELLAGKDNAVLPVVKAQSVECDDILTMGVPNALYSSVAGAPSAANVPDNWDEETMTVWNGCPRKIGQQYVDKVNKKVYYAVAVTGSTNDWVVLN